MKWMLQMHYIHKNKNRIKKRKNTMYNTVLLKVNMLRESELP